MRDSELRTITSRCWTTLLLAAACGNDTGLPPPTNPDRPDGGFVPGDGETIAADDGGTVIAPDGAVLTICQQATTHSDFAFLQQHVFTPSCATAMCHSGPEPEVGLDLSAGRAYSNLVNKGASTVAGWTRVVPSSIVQSYLAVSLGRAEGPPPRDGYMPLGADPLCVEKLEAIERWILAGAPP
jgi:hypothetical protein